MEGDKEGNNEVRSVGQNTGNPNVHELREIANQDAAGVWKLPSVVTAEQLVSSNLTSEKEIEKEGLSRNAVVQTSSGVKELLLLDPP